PGKYEGIDSVSVFFGTDEFPSYYQGHILNDFESKSAMFTLESQDKSSIKNELGELTYTSEFRYLVMQGAHLHPGYILRVVHNNEQEKRIARAALMDFGKNLLIFVL